MMINLKFKIIKKTNDCTRGVFDMSDNDDNTFYSSSTSQDNLKMIKDFYKI